MHHLEFHLKSAIDKVVVILWVIAMMVCVLDLLFFKFVPGLAAIVLMVNGISGSSWCFIKKYLYDKEETQTEKTPTDRNGL